MDILLVGGGGYAFGYVNSLLNQKDKSVVIKGIVEPYFSTCTNKKDIEKANIPVYSSMEDFYCENQAELAIISTPPFLHCKQSIYALSHGSHVLCEKPLAPTVKEAKAMLNAEKEYGKWIAIGYQWSFSKEIQNLKNDILSGLFGLPVSFKTAISWPRDLTYYGRGGGWAGKISQDGALILDSIVSNGCAHYLHNMLFLLGDRIDTSAEVDEYEATCFRANNIESFDTCSLKMNAGGTSLYLIASHAAQKNRDPEFIYKFENALVDYSEESHNIRATFSDGTVKYYGDPSVDMFKKLWDCIDAVRKGITPVCTVKTAMAHTKLIEKMHYNVPINDVPKDIIVFEEKENRIFVDGLYEKMYYAYDNEALLQIK